MLDGRRRGRAGRSLAARVAIAPGHGPRPHEGGALRHGGRRSRRLHRLCSCHRHQVARSPRCQPVGCRRGEATIVRIVSMMRQCVVKNPAAGGGRWVEVPPERFVSWIVAFARRHGGAAGVAACWTVTSGQADGAVTFTAADGAVAECHPPFPAVARLSALLPSLDDPPPDDWAPGADGERAVAEALAADAAADRTVGVLLVRLGGYAVGVFSGSPPRLVSSKTGSRLVHGRSAAGGWSQQRFARRREKQAAGALGAAADTAVAVLGPYAKRLDAVVLGGDRRAIATVRADPRLRPVLEHVVDRFLTVPDPRLTVLRETPRLFRAVRIRLSGPA